MSAFWRRRNLTVLLQFSTKFLVKLGHSTYLKKDCYHMTTSPNAPHMIQSGEKGNIYPCIYTRVSYASVFACLIFGFFFFLLKNNYFFFITRHSTLAKSSFCLPYLKSSYLYFVFTSFIIISLLHNHSSQNATLYLFLLFKPLFILSHSPF